MKKIKFILLVCVSLLMIGSLASCTGDLGFRNEIELTMTENENNEIVATWDTSTKLTSVSFTITYGANTVKMYTLTSNLDKNEYKFPGIHGNYQVSATFKDDSGRTAKFKQNFVKEVEEVNIAPLSATMPVLLFTLASLDESNNLTKNKTVPTYVGLIRSKAYNWDQLPNSFYSIPTIDVRNIDGSGATTTLKEKLFDASLRFAKDLKALNPNTKFNFFVNDYDTYAYFKIFNAFDGNLENVTVKFITDGSASYTLFNTAYNGTIDANDVYSSQLEKYNNLKAQIIETSRYYPRTNDLSIADLRQYTYLIVNENENCEWWLPRIDMFSCNNSEFLANVTKAPTRVLRKNISTMLAEIQKSQVSTNELKNVYKFNDDMFGKSEIENKKTMMLLGSWLVKPSYDTNGEADFADYAKLTMTMYGDDYIYYYKGHPKSPTNMFSDRVELLNELNILDVESSIAAELILFFFPDISMSGFNSSTYQSVSSPEMACIMWNTTLENGLKSAYGKLVGMYATIIDETNVLYGSLVKNRSILIEFNNYQGIADVDSEEQMAYFNSRYNENYAKHEIAIYDTITQTINYYKLVDGAYVEVAK